MAEPQVYIAGIGVTHLASPISDSAISELAISAGTKALLDAGITYDAVNHGLACYLDRDLRVSESAFSRFGNTGAPVSKVDSHVGLFTASQYVKSGHAHCAMVIGLDTGLSRGQQGKANVRQVAAVSAIIVSSTFMASRPYLYDSSVAIAGIQLAGFRYSRAAGDDSYALGTKQFINTAVETAKLQLADFQLVDFHHRSNGDIQKALSELHISDESRAPPSLPFDGTTGLVTLCESVWQLRGWAHERQITGLKNCLQYVLLPDGASSVSILRRADGKPAPAWKDVQHVRDGRERIGYNPTTTTRDITFEDWLAVKARDEFVPEQTSAQVGLPVKSGDRAALARL